jgi:hypothetical protein
MIEEKLAHHEQQLKEWREKQQQLIVALQQAEQQIIAHSAVVEVLRELLTGDGVSAAKRRSELEESDGLGNC